MNLITFSGKQLKETTHRTAIGPRKTIFSHWDKAVSEFDDGNIYQTIAYQANRWRNENLEILAIDNDGSIIAGALVIVFKLPAPMRGIAYVPWGPLWRKKGESPDFSVLEMIVAFLQDMYVYKRGYYLQLFPNVFKSTPDAQNMLNILTNRGFRHRTRLGRTILLDITPPLDEILRSSERKWRQTLGYAQKKGLEVVEDSTVDGLKKGLEIYKQMRKMKGFKEFSDPYILPDVQACLPEELKLRCFFSKKGNEEVAVLSWAEIGGMGLPLLAATSPKGREYDASYLLWWKMIDELKKKNITVLDMGGINRERNPGGYSFKSRLAGRKGKEVERIGEFWRCSHSVTSILVNGGLVIKSMYHKILLALEAYKKPKLHIGKKKELNHL